MFYTCQWHVFPTNPSLHLARGIPLLGVKLVKVTIILSNYSVCTTFILVKWKRFYPATVWKTWNLTNMLRQFIKIGKQLNAFWILLYTDVCIATSYSVLSKCMWNNFTGDSDGIRTQYAVLYTRRCRAKLNNCLSPDARISSTFTGRHRWTPTSYEPCRQTSWQRVCRCGHEQRWLHRWWLHSWGP